MKASRWLKSLVASLLLTANVCAEIQLTEAPPVTTLKKGTSNVTPAPVDLQACRKTVIDKATSTSTKYFCNTSIALTVVLKPDPVIGGTAILTWTAPTKNTDGTTLTDLAGFTLWQSIAGVPGYTSLNVPVGMTTYTLTDLKPGTYTWNVTAYNTAGVKSEASGTVSKTIQ